MAFSKVPTAWLAGISEDGTNLIIPLAALPMLDAAEADAVTGDIRQIVHGLCDAIYEAYHDKDPASIPGKMLVTKTTAWASDGSQFVTYSVRLEVAVTPGSVVDEAT